MLQALLKSDHSGSRYGSSAYQKVFNGEQERLQRYLSQSECQKENKSRNHSFNTHQRVNDVAMSDAKTE